MDWETQRPSAPSTPTSVSSQSTGGTSSSKEKIPPYKQINPSQAVTVLSKLSDDELFRKGPNELLHILRRVESDYKGLLSEHSNLVKDVNRRFQIFVLEARGLKEINQKLQDDNQELRDLCCFLDDDRQRSRKLAREWQRFGRYTASVMHSEVVAYQEKLHQLEERQAELLSDNMELKELCLFLDHERSQMSGDRDDGDGSSNGTVPGHEEMVQSPGDSDGQITPTPTPTPSHQGNEGAYVRQLELKIQRLEEEKSQLAQRMDRSGAAFHSADQIGASRALHFNSDHSQPGHATSDIHTGSSTLGRDKPTPTFSMNKPEAVVHAMKVLQVHEQLERPHDPVGTDSLGDTEKAIVREMCNVVWRKLGDVCEYPPHTTSRVPNQPYRPHSAAGNPIIPSAAPGSARPQPSHSLPNSPSDHIDSPESIGLPENMLGTRGMGQVPSGGRYSGAGRSHPVQNLGSRPPGSGQFGQEQDGQPATRRPGEKETYGQGGGTGNYGQEGGGRDNPTSPGGGGRNNLSSQGGGNKENFSAHKGNRGMQGQTYSQPSSPPSSHSADQPRQMQPPSYPSSKTAGNLMPSSRPGPASQQLSQPHRQAPSTGPPQQPPPRYQQRVHPLHQSQGQVMPRSASSSTTYHVSHPSSQSKSHSVPTLTAYTQQATAAPVPGASYLYSRPTGKSTPQTHFRPYPGSGDQGPRSGTEPGRTEWKQTYLND